MNWLRLVIAFFCLGMLALPCSPADLGMRDGQHDFDFDFGTWKMHIQRLVHPLSGSREWTELEGPTVTNKIWNGRANLATVEADGPSGHPELLALRLYDPRARQWSITWRLVTRLCSAFPR